ncbi:radial spoke head 10 homolog B [Gastrophryne carolinensis]
MGKIKKKDEKRADRLTVDGSEDFKISSASVTPTEELPPPFLKVVSDEPIKPEEPQTIVPDVPEVREESVLTQVIVERYEGELVNRLYEGEGVVYYKDGNVYKGTFSEGLMHGTGTYTWTDGLVYEGEFSRNVPMGHGVYKWPDGSHYEGQVYKAIRHGSGMYLDKDQRVSYVGEWLMGKRHGKGTIYYDAEETSWYEGDWINNTKEGWGVQCFKSGNIYEGQWKNNKFHGVGRMRWLTSNEEYMGQWENGVQNGPGTHTWFLKRVPGSQYSLRNEYVGNFVNGERHGHGQYFYANGAMYDGEWQKNKKHGMGKFVFKNGRIYVGEFANDQIAECPNFKYDRVNTPDLTGIRTQSPGGAGTLNTSPTNTGIPSLSGSYIELEIASLLNNYPENNRLEEQKQVEYGILRNLTMLRKTYKYYSSLGNENCFDNAFLMTKLQFWRFLKDCKMHHYSLTLSEMDRIVTADSRAPEEVHSPYETILLRTFLTHVIYLAYHIAHRDNPEKKISLVDCFSKIMEHNISPHACKVQGYLFSEAQKMEYAMSYIDKCWEIYKKQCQPNRSSPHEPTMTMRSFIWMMNDLKIVNHILTVTKIVDVLGEDDPCVRDGNEINLELELTFLEFFEALFGCALTYVTDDDLINQSLNGAQDNKRQSCVPDETLGDPSGRQLDFSQLCKSKVLDEQDLIDALKANEKRSPPTSFRSSKKLQRKASTEKWFQKIHLFFTKIFFPAYERLEKLKGEVLKNRIRQAEQARLQAIKDEEEARLKALKAEEEEAKKIEQMELERASASLEDLHLSNEQLEDNKNGQRSTPPKEEEPPIPPSTASTKMSPAAGKKKKK